MRQSTELSDQFNLSESESQETVKTGHLRIWDRIDWAQAFLKAPGFIKSEQRGYHVITDRGRELLNLNLEVLTPKKIIELYPDVMESKFWNPDLRSKNEHVDTPITNQIDDTPDDTLESIINQKESLVKSEILEAVINLTPRQFEILVVKVLVAMGYGTGIVTNYTNDGGIDGIIQADELGSEKIHIQAKRYEGKVGK